MITENSITFILGAGASVPFGFPTGLELAERIVEIFKGLAFSYGDPLPSKLNRKSIFEVLNDCGHGEKEIENFVNEFLYSGNNSIDEFLKDRYELSSLGKKAIVLALLPYENESNIAEFSRDNWYRYIWTKIKSDNLSLNKVNFVTYNYDRSLEHFLYSALKHSYGDRLNGEKSADMQINNFNIIHLHGSLGLLPFQLGKEEDKISYGSSITSDVLKRSASQIKIVHESANDESYKKAYEAFSKSSYIYILGFGFHPTNINRLLEFNFDSATRIVFTTYGMSPTEVAIAKTPFDEKGISTDYSNTNIIDFLRSIYTLK